MTGSVPWTPEWIDATATRPSGLYKYQQRPWVHSFVKYLHYFRTGHCWCGRLLKDGRCAPSDDGCNRIPVHPNGVSFGCTCPPIRRAHQPAQPVLTEQVPLLSLARDPQPPPLVLRTPQLPTTFEVEMRRRIARNLNCIIIFYGGPGSRKSYSAMWWLEEFDHTCRGYGGFAAVGVFVSRLCAVVVAGGVASGERRVVG